MSRRNVNEIYRRNVNEIYRRVFLATGDLFDFDIEVKPILEVLVGKNMEQSLLEVMEEEELAHLRAQQRAFEELRNAELVEQQRLEEQVRGPSISWNNFHELYEVLFDLEGFLINELLLLLM